MAKKIITTASIYTKDEAVEGLKDHGAIVEGTTLGCDVIELPEEARVEKDGYDWCYIISFYGPDGYDELSISRWN